MALPLVALILGFISIRTRWVEIADGLHCGIRKSSIWIILAWETLAWSLPAVLSCSAGAFLIARAARGQSQARQLLIVEIPILLSALILPQIGLVLGLLPLKANQLFTYFRARR
ncbi:hypothetical protein [Bifidobacterium favimelis]|uniref:ABC transporter permease n=1 Tax=Bifidobacterium favimelis TaxID=3122979 RepID=A0ABU8ZQ41_9BIFI